MKPRIITLNLPKLIDASRLLPLKGMTQFSDNNLFYLDIDDAYVHQLFPLLKEEGVLKPDYFGVKSAGAHITIIYPEENKQINKADLDNEHHFVVRDLVAAEIRKKIYYILLVESDSLLKLRRKYDLPDLLSFKGYSIGFHITIGVKMA